MNTQANKLMVGVAGDPIAISKDLWGIFFEDISYSADGGLASEMVQNGAFEYSHLDCRDWSNYTCWDKETANEGRAAFAIRDRGSLAPENPHYAVIEVREPDADLINGGFDGMRFAGGASYVLSLWARVDEGNSMPVEAALVDPDGVVLGQVSMELRGDGWMRHEATIVASADCARGRLRLRFRGAGTVSLDFVSLEPAETWNGLAHMRPDLVQALADLHPRFMRFPGGCIVHGVGMDNMYHWKNTIGPVEHRHHNFNAWGYHQSFRVGYMEYLNLCEAIGATPLPILPAGVTCQNTDQGAVPIARADMDDYVREVLDLVEFCNGSADTVWGARRIELGHPEPYGLRYIGIGNEDEIDFAFRDRFRMIVDALHREHSEIRIVGTAGPSPAGKNYEEGWRFAREMGVDVVDEHSYQSPSWWFHNLDRYDGLDRKGPHVYLGEYGSWGTMLINALSEAAFMAAGMERNGDVVDMASYAPLFCKNGHDSWNPDLIYFDNERTYRTYSYWVQRMFATTACDHAVPLAADGPVTRIVDLPGKVDLRCYGRAGVDLTGISITLPDGTVVDAPDMSLDGETYATVDAGLDLAADAYTIDMTVLFHGGSQGFRVRFGDVDGMDSSEVMLGRGQAICVVRDGSAYELASTSWIHSGIPAGTRWSIRIEVADRGRSVRLFRNGELLLEGHEEPLETRRVVSAVLDEAAGVAYVRCVNATREACDVDLGAVLDGLGWTGADRTETDRPGAGRVAVTVLSGDDPYAGTPGTEAPAPVDSIVDLTDGVYHAPAWSFSVIELPVDAHALPAARVHDVMM